jgi:hypothetical protein
MIENAIVKKIGTREKIGSPEIKDVTIDSAFA